MPTTVDPGEGCFAAHGLQAPEWVEGEAPGPGVPVWCRPLFHIPPPSAPRVVGACSAEVSGVEGGWAHEEQMRYDAQGRLVEWLAEGRRHVWRYEGPRLKVYLKMWSQDGRIEELQAYDEFGRVIEYEEQHAGGQIHTRKTLTWAHDALTEFRSISTHDDGLVHDHLIRIDPETGAPAETIKTNGDGVIEMISRTTFDAHTGEFVTVTETDAREESRGRCTREGLWVPSSSEAMQVSVSGRQVQRSWEGGRSLIAYDAEGRVTRSYSEREGKIEEDERFVYDAAGRLVCNQRLHWSRGLEWPPLREGVPGVCSGLCTFLGAIELPWGRPIQARAQMRYDDQGHLLKMALDVGADGSIEQVLDFDVGYDDHGRLIREGWLGAWSLMRAEYTYDCPAE
ncbi:hypothetical protein KKF91_01100 [Myxococcota bacterium]|nr:hypothetical protein [Myxococcota bacterium]